MNSSGFAADIICSMISELENDIPVDFIAGNCSEIFTHAIGFKKKSW